MIEILEEQMVCDFCHEINPQKKKLLYILFKMLSKQLTLTHEKYAAIKEDSQCNGFKQLIKIIFNTDFYHPQVNCLHSKIFNFFLKKLKCSGILLEFLCKRIAERIAQRNYHLETLTLQIKNSSQSIFDNRIQIKIAHKQQEHQNSIITQKKEDLKEEARELQLKQKQFKTQNRFEEKNPNIVIFNEGNTHYIPIIPSELNIPQINSLNSIQNITCPNNMANMNSMSTIVDYNSMYCLPFTFIYNQSHPNQQQY